MDEDKKSFKWEATSEGDVLQWPSDESNESLIIAKERKVIDSYRNALNLEVKEKMLIRFSRNLCQLM